MASILHFSICTQKPMKNDYIKQALVLEIERFKIFLTLLAVAFGSLVPLLQNKETDNRLLVSVIIIISIIGILAIKTHFDIENLIKKLRK